jgi:hypothetical protein
MSAYFGHAGHHGNIDLHNAFKSSGTSPIPDHLGIAEIARSRVTVRLNATAPTWPSLPR